MAGDSLSFSESAVISAVLGTWSLKFLMLGDEGGLPYGLFGWCPIPAAITNGERGVPGTCGPCAMWCEDDEPEEDEGDQLGGLPLLFPLYSLSFSYSETPTSVSAEDEKGAGWL